MHRRLVAALATRPLSRLSSSSQSLNAAPWNEHSQSKWAQAVSNAEKVVGPSKTSFTWNLLTNKSSIGAAGHLQRLLGTTHPAIATIRKLINDGCNQLQTRGLVVLLLSRCAGHIEGSPQMFVGESEEAAVEGVTERQRSMAEIVGMVYTSHLIHRDVLNVSRDLITDAALLDELQYGNKIAILVGDILIANASKRTAELNDCKVLELIAISIGDFMKSEFVVRHDSFGKPYPPRRMDLFGWEQRIFFSTGSLLANACQAVVLMGGHGESTQHRAKEFGRNLGLAWQLRDELEPFVNILHQKPDSRFDLTSLPVLLYMQRHPHIFASLEAAPLSSSAECADVNRHIDYADLYAQIVSSGVVDEARQRLHSYVDTCLSTIEGFDQCYRAKQAMNDVLLALK